MVPAPTAITNSRRVRRHHCRHWPVIRSATAMTSRENASRHAAIASGCAVDRRTRGPESETPSSASPRTTGARRSVPGVIMTRASACHGEEDRHGAADDLHESGDEWYDALIRLPVVLGDGHDATRARLGYLVRQEGVPLHRLQLPTRLNDERVIVVGFRSRSARRADVVVDPSPADVSH